MAQPESGFDCVVAVVVGTSWVTWTDLSIGSLVNAAVETSLVLTREGVLCKISKKELIQEIHSFTAAHVSMVSVVSARFMIASKHSIMPRPSFAEVKQSFALIDWQNTSTVRMATACESKKSQKKPDNLEQNIHAYGKQRTTLNLTFCKSHLFAKTTNG